MNWTQEKPTQPGWYWVYHRGALEALRVGIENNPIFRDQLIARSTSGGAAPISATPNYWWMGPLPVPAAPEAT
jgi:hypothetical protein